MARSFAAEQLAPHAGEWDEHCVFPVATLREAAKLGLAGIYVDETHGGAGLSRLDAAIIFEELAAGCTSTAAYISIHNMVAWMIDAFGSDQQRAGWLPDLTTMDRLASYCLTEPDAGSDAAGLQTRAERQGDDYVLNGSKAFISGAGETDLYACMVRTGGDGPNGISCVDRRTRRPGSEFRSTGKKAGMAFAADGSGAFSRIVGFRSARASGRKARGLRSPCRVWMAAGSTSPPAPSALLVPVTKKRGRI